MILLGLTGGIASGKSTVAQMLRARGAEVIDADRIGHEVLRRGGPAFELVVDRFGAGVLGDDGEIDRAKLALVVFNDAIARRDLEAISHPLIYQEIVRRIDELRDTDKIVVLDAALLVETSGDRGRSLGLHALVVVSATVDLQMRRMMEHRGMSDEAARARMGAQAAEELKLAQADYILQNRSTIEDLEASVDLVYEDVKERFG